MVVKQFGYRFAQGFAYGDYEQSTIKTCTKRKCLLAQMEAVVPWQALVDLIEPHYPNTSNMGGRVASPLETMLRILLLQKWYSLSDPALEDAVIEVASMRRFVGIAQITDRNPDETMILVFWHLLDQADLGERIFVAVKEHRKAKGVAMKQGTIIDITIIAVPSLTINKKCERDSEMNSSGLNGQAMALWDESPHRGRKRERPVPIG